MSQDTRDETGGNDTQLDAVCRVVGLAIRERAQLRAAGRDSAALDQGLRKLLQPRAVRRNLGAWYEARVAAVMTLTRATLAIMEERRLSADDILRENPFALRLLATYVGGSSEDVLEALRPECPDWDRGQRYSEGIAKTTQRVVGRFEGMAATTSVLRHEGYDPQKVDEFVRLSLERFANQPGGTDLLREAFESMLVGRVVDVDALKETIDLRDRGNALAEDVSELDAEIGRMFDSVRKAEEKAAMLADVIAESGKKSL